MPRCPCPRCWVMGSCLANVYLRAFSAKIGENALSVARYQIPGAEIQHSSYLRLMIYFWTSLLVFIFMTCIFLAAVVKKDNSIVDIFWGAGFILISWFTLLFSGEITIKKIILSSLVTLWGLRLSIHIYLRNKGRPEDFRYHNWRKTWKHFYLRSFLQVFMLQGLMMLFIASSIILVNNTGRGSFGFLEVSGVCIMLFGLFFEAVGDQQLANFRKNPGNQGRIITTGLWKYTRHPNYFGETVFWWGVWLFAIPEIDGVFTMVSPLTITILLRYVSGVPMLEKKYEGRSDWDEYRKRVPPFFPVFRSRL